MEVRKIYKAGNSYVISIPKQVIKLLNLKVGDQILFKWQQDQVILTPIVKKNKIEVIRRIAGCLADQEELVQDLLEIRELESDREGTVLE
ncbi:Antidote-toxin recognition MazE, antitoxin [Carboxydocella sporoproducens DSM 16521]|uniref:Antidote-toxin recognition MazE, antitoxin n=2 Tax=Carboxydocella TaxID=178898 RepID=A0A1T4NHA1_9FIRM|nr:MULTISPECIES: AbrB/MazE/SpoVT family DNA-binding domain-containing protein [Carboxydocella]AVX20039.1 Antidote-toxin recognition MazE, antitoxin [Carboxydocella thermautotrophica]AVX30456.1 Antidote-toxin recognition MazE, antitoxin [Carboxydocella thermautotrophica]SJZ78535.1 Antidote-toxin recognition MazE, antitoxin [Carboxydocella sporoproducens DSM 16521]